MEARHRPLPAMSLAVVGGRYANRDGSNRQFEIAMCVPGEPVELRPEPRNRHDERAVAVFSTRGFQIGYLTAERCGRIGALIREGREVNAVFQAKSDFGAWIRVAFDGAVPEVPAQKPDEGADEEGDFWPDPVWPDE